MIRFSDNQDKEKLIELWSEVFGDSREAIELFFDYHFDCRNTLVSELDGRIVSMLYLIKGSFVISDESHPSYYLYAAATDCRYRGKGIMAEMLGFAKQTATDRGIDFICLLPAEKSLYGFYEKFGYKTVFKKKISEIKINEITQIKTSEYNIIDYEMHRKSFFDGYDRFEWNGKDIEYAIRQHEFYGGKAVLNRKGYCLYSADEEKIYVKESTLQPYGLFENGKDVFISLPVGYQSDDSDGEIIDSGMALPLNEKAASALEKSSNAYLGLTLD